MGRVEPPAPDQRPSATISQWAGERAGYLCDIGNAQATMLEKVAHLVLDLEWPFIVEQVQIEEFGRHQASVLQTPTFDYGMAFRPGIPCGTAAERGLGELQLPVEARCSNGLSSCVDQILRRVGGLQCEARVGILERSARSPSSVCRRRTCSTPDVGRTVRNSVSRSWPGSKPSTTAVAANESRTSSRPNRRRGPRTVNPRCQPKPGADPGVRDRRVRDRHRPRRPGGRPGQRPWGLRDEGPDGTLRRRRPGDDRRRQHGDGGRGRRGGLSQRGRNADHWTVIGWPPDVSRQSTLANSAGSM